MRTRLCSKNNKNNVKITRLEYCLSSCQLYRQCETVLGTSSGFCKMASERRPQALTAKEERVVLNLLQQGKSNLAVLNHYSTQDMELVLEQV